MLSNQWFGRRRFLKVFYLWQPEFFMEHNYVKEFERGLPKEHSSVKTKNLTHLRKISVA